MNNRTDILDLRTALDVLRHTPGQLIETNVEVNSAAELSGVYRYVGAGGTVMRPTQVDGPAMLFHNVKGHPGASVAIGVLASRERVATLFGCKKEELGHLVQSCAANPIQPVVVDGPAPCQEIVHRAEDEDFDLFKLIPAPTNTPVDAGPYITLGMCYATHPDTELSDVTIHRMCIQGTDELSIFLQPGSRHIGAMAERATELGQPLLVCGECGSPYKRCTWARNGKKRVVWRCVSRLEFGRKYCHSSPTLDEGRLHRAILAALNEYGAIQDEVRESAMELAEMAQGYGRDGGDMAPLRQRLDELTAEQALLLDKVLADMDNLELNAQLKALAEEKQGILEQMEALQQKAERQALLASRRQELAEWLAQQPAMLTEYDDGVTRRLVERITVVDAETIRVKLRDTDVEIEEKLC